jgi:[glutamine synthetase] adenylyltransferase / [glutamine synthetase]-adenylyl-L-tyrosine phosphorylase
MEIEQLRHHLDHPSEATRWLNSLGVDDPERAHANLIRMATAGVTLDLLANIADQLAEHLPKTSDPDMALNNLDRFVAAARNPLSLASLFERDREALPILLQIFSTSQYLSDLLVTDSEAYDLVRITEGQPVARTVLVDELWAEVDALQDERAVMTALRRFKRRETLRIAYGDIIRGQRLEIVTGQISHLADAILEAAVRFARKSQVQKRGLPRTAEGKLSRFAVLAMGKLGGGELNYSSDIDLIFLYEADGNTDGQRQMANVEYFDRLARDVVKLLTESTDLGVAYRVDLRLRPEGQRGPMVPSLESALHYYDVSGRTWERQAFVKARAAAGDLEFGQAFLAQLEPWVYRRYLSRADITGIKALKRRIEHHVKSEGADLRNVKTGHGGIRDIEFTIQFLQLLNGGELPAMRTGNTLEAIAKLENGGCLTGQERSILGENYAFLRKIEHRLQIMFDLQTHMLPSTQAEQRALAIRMGYSDASNQTALDGFTSDYQQKTALNRKILDHLLHDAFGEEDTPEPEVDLILDPDPAADQIKDVLGRYPFHDVKSAYQNLMTLSQERIRFLSTRRCRHFLASIAPRLLPAIATTPDPDSTLVSLSKVSDSLGGKGVLWELFSFNPPSLHMYVELCASSPYLSSILISNPGMIDELMDSLVLDKLPTRESLEANLQDLARGAEDLDLILHSFKNAQVLRVGVRDILGKEDIVATCSSLADIAEVCLRQITRTEYSKLSIKMGEPMVPDGDLAGSTSEFIVLSMGKFGGREINYHSDLDMVFLYEADGGTFHARRSRRSGETSTNQHFFSELGQRVIKMGSQLGPHGRLYEIDPRLRPTGKSGALTTSLIEFRRYFEEGSGQLWERQALCKARVVYGSPRATAAVMQTIADCAYNRPWQREYADQIRSMRHRMEETAKPANLKRGPGGLVDVEFIAQMLQLKYGGEHEFVRTPGTLDALEALEKVGAISRDDFDYFSGSYRILLAMVSRLRLMNTTARHDLPDDEEEQIKLARLLGYPDREKMLIDCRELTRENRARFDRIFAREGTG